MEAQPAKTGLLTHRALRQIEPLSASLLPGAALLFVSVIGTKWLLPAYIGPFILVFSCSTVVIVAGEFLLVAMMQRTAKEQYTDLISVCQAYLEGNRERRAIIREDGAPTATLARTLNALLDSIEKQEKEPPSQKSIAPGASEAHLQQQLKRLINEIAPVVDADLRVKAEATTGDIGALADICNHIIQKLAQQIKVTRSATELITNTTHRVIERSIEFAQASETHLADLSQTIEKVENLSAFVQRLNSRLALHVNNEQGAQTHDAEQEHDPLTKALIAKDETSQANDQDSQPAKDTHQQGQLLEEALTAIQEQTAIAEPLIGKLYGLAQGIHQSSTHVLNTVEQISPLVTMADQWRNSIAVFHLLDDDNYQNAWPISEMEADGQYQIPFHSNKL